MAGTSATLAGLCLVVAAACLVLFFTTEREAWGRADDATTARFALFMIPAMFEVYERYAPGARWSVGLPTAAGLLARSR